MLYDLEFLEGIDRLWPYESEASLIAVADLAT